MPITDTLKNAEDFRRVGFTQEQATMLAAKLEDTAHRQSEDLKQFIQSEMNAFRAEIRQEFALFRAEMDARFEAVLGKVEAVRAEFKGELRESISELRADMGNMRGDFQSALRDQLVKFVAIVAALITAAVAIVKLLPNAHP
jgi:hypothetical protein